MKKLNIKEIKDRNSSLINQLLEVWEDSVKATHLFLSSEELKIFAHGPYNGTCKIVSKNQVNLSVTNVKPRAICSSKGIVSQ